MNVLMLASRFHPHVGGVEKHLWELLTELLLHDYECTIITEKYQDDLPTDETINLPTGTVRVKRFAKNSNPENHIFSRKTCWPELLKLKHLISSSDLVHCHDYATFIYWYLPLRFLYPFKKVYITFHGWEGICPPPRKTILLRKLAEKLTSGNICIGEFICKWYKTNASFISYGGVRSNEIADSNEVMPREAVFIGRLAHDTGIMTYLEALLELQKLNIDLSLTVCGDGPLKNKCIQFATENNLKVRFNGFIDNPVKSVASASFAFVSGYLAILEAMTAGKLVFSVFDNPLKEDYLRMHPANSGMMYVAGTSDELALQLETCINESSHAIEMVLKGQTWASTQSWSKVANTYNQLWRVHS